MTDKSGAWVWSQYRGVISESVAGSGDAADASSSNEDRVVPLRTVPGSGREVETQKAGQRRTKYGIVIGLAALAGLFFPMIAALLIIVAVLLIASGREPKRINDFLASVPGGSFVGKCLTDLDRWL